MNAFLSSRSVSPRDRRALGGGLLIVGSVFVAGRGYPAWLAWSRSVRLASEEHVRAAAEAAHGARLLEEMRDSARARATLLAALRQSLIVAGGAAEAGAALAVRVSELATANGVRVLAMSIRSDSATSDPTLRVTLRLSLATDVDGLTDLLRDLEDGSTMLAVRELGVEQSAPASADSSLDELRVELVVEGLALRTASQGGAAFRAGSPPAP